MTTKQHDTDSYLLIGAVTFGIVFFFVLVSLAIAYVTNHFGIGRTEQWHDSLAVMTSVIERGLYRLT